MVYYISIILGVIVFLLIPILFVMSLIRNAKHVKKSGIAEKKNK